MLEDDYSRCLNRLLKTCECDLVVPSDLKESLALRGVATPVFADNRQFVRYHLNGLAILEYDQTFPTIPREHTIARIVTRTISRGGIAFLHAEQLFPGEQATIWLPSGKHAYRVVRCVSHNSRCFEIGAEAPEQLTVPVDVKQFSAR